MAALPNGNPTLADWSKEVDPKGRTPAIVHMLTQTNEITLDATFMPGNLPTGHQVTVDATLPTNSKRAFNEGIAPTKGTSQQFEENFAMFEQWSEVDVDLVGLNGNDAGFRLNQARRHLDSLNQDVALSTVYGNPAANPKDFLGFHPRMSQHTNAANSSNVIHCGGSGSDNTSILLVGWGPGSVYMGYPEGSAAGLIHTDFGMQVSDTAGGTPGSLMAVYRDRFQWKTGLVVEDWRSCVRLVNIDVSDLKGITGTQAITAYATNVIHQMEEAIYRIEQKGLRLAFYMNRSTHAAVSRMAMVMSSAAVTVEKGLSQFGEPMRWRNFMEVPMRRVDQMLNSEALVPA